MKYGIWLFTGEYGGYGWLSTIGDRINNVYLTAYRHEYAGIQA